MDRALCRHCRKFTISRPKRLCYGCSKNAAIRTLYATTSKYARNGVGNANRRVMPEPTIATPGSEAKILVMMARAEAGEHLFHPLDATSDGVVAWLNGHAGQATHRRKHRRDWS